MKSPQDEVNARLAKMYWLLSAKRVRMDADQVDDLDELRREVARPDALIVLSPRRDKNGVFEVDDQMKLSDQQFKALQSAMDAFPKSAGIYQTMLGDKEPGVVSGVAMSSLVEQGTTTLAEINDNYRYGRRSVGQLLLELVREDLGSTPKVVSVDEKFGRQKKTITLNQPRMIQGVQLLDNDIQRALVKVGLEDVPSTPTYRQHQFLMLGELTKALPPQIQAFVVPFILEASEMPHRREVADQIRKALGMPGGEQTTFTPEQVTQIVQQEIQKFIQQSEMGIKLREVAVKEKDAESKRLIAEKDLDLKTLHELLEHDRAMDQQQKVA